LPPSREGLLLAVRPFRVTMLTFQELPRRLLDKIDCYRQNLPDKTTLAELYVPIGERDRANTSAPEAVGNAYYVGTSSLELKCMLVVDDTLRKSLCFLENGRRYGDSILYVGSPSRLSLREVKREEVE
jgi:hypothetical protein